MFNEICFFNLGKIEIVRNKLLYGFCALLTVFMSVFMSFGICLRLNFTSALIVNRLVPAMVASGEMYSPQTVANTLDVPLLGFVPEDQSVLRALGHHHTVMDEEGPARQALERISQRFLGEFVPMPTFDKKRRWFGRH